MTMNNNSVDKNSSNKAQSKEENSTPSLAKSHLDDVKNSHQRTDAVTAELRKGFAWSVGHSKAVIGALVIFVFGGLAYSAVKYFSDKKEAQAQEHFYAAEKNYISLKEKYTPKENKAPSKNSKEAPAVQSLSSGDLDKDYGSVISDLNKVIQESAGSKAAAMSALLIADLQVEYKKNTLAIDTLKQVKTDGTGLVGLLLNDRLASLIADSGDCKTAISMWDGIINNKSAEFMVGELKLKKGLCFESLKDFTQAQVMYTQAKDSDAAGTGVGKRAEKYLRLLPLAPTGTSLPAAQKN